MAANDEQHFVPQFCLRPFASDQDQRRISLVCLSSCAVIHGASIKHQAKGRKFYGDASNEAWFTDIENKAAPIISRCLCGESIPPRWSYDYFILMHFIAILWRRTPRAIREIEMAYNIHNIEAGVGECIDFGDGDGRRGTPFSAISMSMRFAMSTTVMMLDLEMRILRAPAGTAFVVGDHPVVRYNQEAEYLRVQRGSTAVSSHGIQIFLPIAPSLCIVLYDGRSYQVGGRRRHLGYVATDEEGVASINRLQAFYAHRLIYFAGPDTEQAAVNASRASSDDRANAIRLRKVATQEVDGAGLLGKLSHTYTPPPSLGLRIGSIRINPKSRSLIKKDAVNYRRPDVVEHLHLFEDTVATNKERDARHLTHALECVLGRVWAERLFEEMANRNRAVR